MCQPAVADQHEIIRGQDMPSVVIQLPECHKSRFVNPDGVVVLSLAEAVLVVIIITFQM
jgi:hypothetical protein